MKRLTASNIGWSENNVAKLIGIVLNSIKETWWWAIELSEQSCIRDHHESSDYEQPANRMCDSMFYFISDGEYNTSILSFIWTTFITFFILICWFNRSFSFVWFSCIFIQKREKSSQNQIFWNHHFKTNLHFVKHQMTAIWYSRTAYHCHIIVISHSLFLFCFLFSLVFIVFFFFVFFTVWYYLWFQWTRCLPCFVLLGFLPATLITAIWAEIEIFMQQPEKQLIGIEITTTAVSHSLHSFTYIRNCGFDWKLMGKIKTK